MNAGAIASRYAKALLDYVMERGSGKTVYDQACMLMKMMEQVPLLKEVLARRNDISHETRMEVIQTALGGRMAVEFDRFVGLLETNSRIEFIDRMIWSFIHQYRKANNIVTGHLVTAVDAPELKEKMTALFSEKTGADVRMEMKTDPDIIGGFIFEMDGKLVDASISTQLRRLRKELVDTGKRII